MKYKIIYEQVSTRISIVEADNKDKALENFEEGNNIIEDFEEDSDGGTVTDIEEMIK